MMEGTAYPRFTMARLEEALADSPVVLIHGPRQCGKTTLALEFAAAKQYAYFSFDDPVILSSAMADPAGFIAGLPERVILDEVQRAPVIFSAIKLTVDRKRTPGRFILTGSANVLLVPHLSDSLAGRMAILRLHPLAQCELARRDPLLIDRIFDGRFKTRQFTRLGQELAARVAAGGFPAALARSTDRRRQSWYRDYVDTIASRDVRDMSRIASLDALPRLMTLAAGQTGRLSNISELAAPFQLSRTTIRDYVTLLERVFLIEHLSPWHSNRLSRLVKSPKLHLCDSGVACSLLGLDGKSLWEDRAAFGQLLETFVFQELRRLASWHERDVRFHHYRDKDGYEVDIVLEDHAGKIAGVEVKASATVTSTDFRGIKRLKEATANRFTSGIVLYDGETCVGFGEGLYAVPIRALWEPM
jgi:predicted AAA+ superfamily ATPase